MCSLKHAFFDENKNGNIILQSLKNVSSLISLEMSYAYLTSHSLKPLESLFNLRSLKLDHNKINFIADATFANQKNLQHLNVSHNALSSLSINSLLPLQKLTILDVSGNNILKVHGYENMRKALPVMSFIGIFGNKFEDSYLLKLLQTLKAQNIKVMSMDGSVSHIGMTNDFEPSMETTTLENLQIDIETAATVEEITRKNERKLSATALNQTEQKCDGVVKEPSNLVEKISLTLLCVMFLMVVYLSWCLKQTRDSLKHYVLQHMRMNSSKRSSTSTLAALEDTFY